MNIIWLRQSQKNWAIIPAILIIALLSGSASFAGEENEANTTVSISEQAMAKEENSGILKEADTILASTQPKTKFSKSEAIPAVLTKSKVNKKSESDTKETTAEARRLQSGETSVELPGTPKRYTGTKISMDFYNADIHNVFRLISDISGLNIVVADDVKGKVTLRLIDVPWDQALDLILASQGLGMTRVGNVIRIAPAEKLRKEQDMAAQAAQARLDARKKKEELEPLVAEYIQINYAKAEDLVPRVTEVMSERGKVTFDERTNMLIVHDIRKSIENIQFLVKTLDKVTPQVMIEARIVEAQATFARELGIRWGVGYYRDVWNIGDTNFMAAGASTPLRPTETTYYGIKGVEPSVNLPVASPTGTIGFMFSKLGRDIWSVDAELSALEQEGKIKIVSAPKVATLDNKEAMIKQGKEIPYLEYTEEGTVSTVFKEVVLQLTVTPHITPDGRVKMKIATKKDELDWINAVVMYEGRVPALDKKEAETELLANDGETIVIGGVIREKEEIVMRRVPFLWKIPLLGRLFQYKSIEKEKTELLIFIAPTIIKEEKEGALLGQS